MKMLRKLDTKQQCISFVLTTIVSLEILASIYFLHGLSKMTLSADKIFLVICISGFFGGATRALNVLIGNLNEESLDNISARLSRWFLYLMKPFIGVGGGLSFFIVTNIGLLTGIKLEAVGFDFYGVLLISFTGGMFFEDVFVKLHDTIFKKKEKNRQQTNIK